MIIDGEKYACEACVRGHRVSNCQHSDRPLQHINKKGRPVSQCTHCRSLRKSRAAHVKCDCGEKSSKCAHLQQTVEGHKETCCCNHGGRCTCCNKMETSLHTVPETDSDVESRNSASAIRPKPPARRRRANTVHSDAGLSFDQNGHHKPTSKINRVSQKSNPYQLNRVNSATSASSMGANPESLIHPPAGDGHSRVAAARAQRRVKSEATSPLMTGSGFHGLGGNLPPLDLSQIEYPSYAGSSSFDLFGNGSGMPSDPDGPMYSAGLGNQSVDWSHYDLADGGDFTPSSYSQAGAQSFNGLFEFGSGSEQLPHLANTTSTSGEVSEVEDFMSGGDADLDSFTTGQSFLRSGMVGANADISSIGYDSFYKNADSVAMPGVSMVEEDPAFWMPNYNEGVGANDDATDPLAAGTSLSGSYWEM